MTAINRSMLPLVTLDFNALLSYFKVLDATPDVTPKNRVDAQAMQLLFDLQHSGKIRLIVPATAILEARRPDDDLTVDALVTRLQALDMDVSDIYVGPTSIGFSSASAPHTVTYAFDLELGLHQALHTILFEGKSEPSARNVAFSWFAYRDRECARRGITGNEEQALVELDGIHLRGNVPLSPLALSGSHMPTWDALEPSRRAALEASLKEMRKTWTNTKCDAEGLYIHASHALNTREPQHSVFVTSDRNFKRLRPLLKKTNWQRLQDLGFPGQVMEPGEAAAYLASLFRKDFSAGGATSHT